MTDITPDQLIEQMVQHAMMFGWSVAIPTSQLDSETVPCVIMGYRNYVLGILQELQETHRFDLYTPPTASSDA